MKIMFCTSNLPGAILIRTITWSRWSHVAVLLDDDTAIEATFPKVKLTPVSDLKDKYRKWCIVDVDVPNEQNAIDFAKKQLGKSYDVSAVIGLMFHRDWAQDSEWFCSELATAIIEAGGRHLFRHNVVNRIVPEYLWILCNPIIEERK